MSLTLEDWNDVSKLQFKNKDTFEILEAIPIKALIEDGKQSPVLVTYRIEGKFNCWAFFSIDGKSATNNLQTFFDFEIVHKESGTNIQNAIIYMMKNNIMFVFDNIWYTIYGIDLKNQLVLTRGGSLYFSTFQKINVYYNNKIVPFDQLVNEVDKVNLHYSAIINWNNNDNS